MDYDLMGVTEIAALLGISPQRDDQLAATEAFPDPAARLAAGRVWTRNAIEQWARETGRIT